MATCTVHPQAEEAQPCGACGRPFCENCLADIMGQRLCQDCKARAVHTIVEPSRLHPQAVPCLVVGIIAAVFGCAAPVISPIALYLGSKVLHDMPARPHPSSRTVALAGMVAAGGTLGLWLVAAVAALLFRGGGR